MLEMVTRDWAAAERVARFSSHVPERRAGTKHRPLKRRSFQRAWLLTPFSLRSSHVSLSVSLDRSIVMLPRRPQCESEAQCQTLVTCFNRLIKESA